MKVLVFLALFGLAFASVKHYNGFQVFRALPKEEAHWKAIQDLENGGNFDFWKISGKHADIMASPTRIEVLRNFLEERSIPYERIVPDVEDMITKAAQEPKVSQGPRSTRYALTWDNYYGFDTIKEFCFELAASYPQMVTTTVEGQSHEGRDMILVKISNGGAAKPAVFVDGGIHAREWISPASVTYFMRELVENYAAHPELVNNVDWYFMPVINPDGYQFSHDSDRLWRKNRRPNEDGCRGTDMNRNFGFHWNEGGSSGYGCYDTYHGGAPFSEVESQVVRDVILANADQIQAYLTVHSYGQYWLTPWGWTSDYPEDYPELFALASDAVDALTAVEGTRYTIETSTNALYMATGGSDDWAKGGAGVKYSYTLELRDTGFYGFQLPARLIMPTAVETWEAIKVVGNFIGGMKK
ncbi:carboxypeptidase B-like [Artemia franciscana]|uniref:carboxypeptidase B-like n=1 Tax=Artemia franciscana TaxID=6661 RepID=UPI0032D9F4D5